MDDYIKLQTPEWTAFIGMIMYTRRRNWLYIEDYFNYFIKRGYYVVAIIGSFHI